MNKKILVTIIVIFISLMLSGCEEQEINSNEDRIEIVDYTFSKQEDRCLVQGTIKNNINEEIGNIRINAKFFDINNNYLNSVHIYIMNLSSLSTRDFEISYYSWQLYFDDIENVELEIIEISET